jgi:hypothetical protein
MRFSSVTMSPDSAQPHNILRNSNKNKAKNFIAEIKPFSKVTHMAAFAA